MINTLPNERFSEGVVVLCGKARFAGNRVIVTHHPKVAGAFIPMEDLEIIQSLEDKRDAEILKNALRSGEFEDWEVVKKRLLIECGVVDDEVPSKKERKSF